MRESLAPLYERRPFLNSRPDIVLLVLDTQRLDRLSCYGNRLETTPNLDTFASEATLYRHALSTAQWTVPSHSSMFTGLYPSDHTMFHASSVLPTSLTTLAERLNSRGYFTTAFCNNPLVGILNNGLRRGFYSFLNHGGLMTSRPNQANVNRRLFDRYRQHFKRLLAHVLTATQDAFARSDTLLDFSFSPWMVSLWQTALHFKGNTAKALDDAARLLIGHNISLYNELVHVPLMIRDPEGNLPQGVTHEQVVSLRRIFHTVLTAAGMANSLEEALSFAQHANADADQGLVFAEGIKALNALRLLQRRRPALVAEKALDQPRIAIWKDQYKLIRVGEDHLELYNILHDQDEQINLVETQPGCATSLQSLLRSYVDHTAPTTPEVIDDDYDNDPEIYLRLRDLGYVE